MKLSREQFLGIVRHGLTFVGGIVVAGGMLDQGSFTELSGGLITIAGVIWSILSKRKSA